MQELADCEHCVGGVWREDWPRKIRLRICSKESGEDLEEGGGKIERRTYSINSKGPGGETRLVK